jgi:hypothetical protein
MLTFLTVPAVILGIALGPVAARFLDAERWGPAVEGQQEAITLVSHIQYREMQIRKLMSIVLLRVCAES